MTEFVILKAFNVKIHPSKAYKIKKILWYSPLIFWTKCNSDGAARGSLGNALILLESWYQFYHF
jgi:hypothetical protein